MSVFELTQVDSPLVISVPHDGALIPNDIKATMNPVVSESSDRDLLINEVFVFEQLNYSKIKANYSRHVIDLNRPVNGESLYSDGSGTELCPTTTFDFQPIYLPAKNPSELEIKQRVELYWQPYHVQLSQLIQAAKDQYGYCLLIDAHSIDAVVPRFFNGQLPQLNIGTFNGTSCAKELEVILLDHLTGQSKWDYIVNGRFKGGYITREYGSPDNGIHAIQLEHSKAAYLSPNNQLSTDADHLRQFWHSCISDLLDRLHKNN